MVAGWPPGSATVSLDLPAASVLDFSSGRSGKARTRTERQSRQSEDTHESGAFGRARQRFPTAHANPAAPRSSHDADLDALPPQQPANLPR